MAVQTKEFGAKLKGRRRELKISRVNLAKMLNVTEFYIYLIETGSRFPSDELLIKLSEILKFTIDYSAIVQFEEKS